MAGPPLEPETKKEGREGGEEERNLSMYHIDFPPVKNPGKLPLH